MYSQGLGVLRKVGNEVDVPASDFVVIPVRTLAEGWRTPLCALAAQHQHQQQLEGYWEAQHLCSARRFSGGEERRHQSCRGRRHCPAGRSCSGKAVPLLDNATSSLSADKKGLSKPRTPSPPGTLPLLAPAPAPTSPAIPPCLTPPHKDLPSCSSAPLPRGPPGLFPAAHWGSAAASSPAAQPGTPPPGQLRSPRSRPQPAGPSAAVGRRGHLPRAARAARGERFPSPAQPGRAARPELPGTGRARRAVVKRGGATSYRQDFF